MTENTPLEELEHKPRVGRHTLAFIVFIIVVPFHALITLPGRTMIIADDTIFYWSFVITFCGFLISYLVLSSRFKLFGHVAGGAIAFYFLAWKFLDLERVDWIENMSDPTRVNVIIGGTIIGALLGLLEYLRGRHLEPRN